MIKSATTRKNLGKVRSKRNFKRKRDAKKRQEAKPEKKRKSPRARGGFLLRKGE